MTDDTAAEFDPTEAFDLTGRVAAVTGGTRGIGRAITLGLANAGADVVPTSRTEADVEDAVAAVESRGGDSLSCPTDVTDGEAVTELTATVREELGGSDVVVSNDGVDPRGALRCARAAAEGLTAGDGGSLVNVASVAGLVGLPRQHPYVASKHGLVGVTRRMALDWAPDVRVNAVAPGFVLTELTAEIEGNERLEESIRDRTPLGRFADAAEVAAPAVFLASDAASYVASACLAVDGDWTTR
ncbi:dehydrogenase [Halobacteriales archaeon QS_6_71_20]|nr:MAG: dehydrogenase [Halobacteriales archaeon QS_6_71_20]